MDLRNIAASIPILGIGFSAGIAEDQKTRARESRDIAMQQLNVQRVQWQQAADSKNMFIASQGLGGLSVRSQVNQRNGMVSARYNAYAAKIRNTYRNTADQIDSQLSNAIFGNILGTATLGIKTFAAPYTSGVATASDRLKPLAKNFTTNGIFNKQSFTKAMNSWQTQRDNAFMHSRLTSLFF